MPGVARLPKLEGHRSENGNTSVQNFSHAEMNDRARPAQRQTDSRLRFTANFRRCCVGFLYIPGGRRQQASACLRSQAARSFGYPSLWNIEVEFTSRSCCGKPAWLVTELEGFHVWP